MLLADKSPGSSDKQTRNSAGKSSLVEIAHFLLGARADPASLMRNPALVEFTFRATIQLGEAVVTVARSGADPAKIFISQQDAERLGLKPLKNKQSGLTYVSNETWKDALGHWMFRLPAQTKGSLYEESFTPSFRSLISYFARMRGGFTSPEKSSDQQHPWNWQVNLSYLLGLDWRVPFDLQKVRERENQLTELKKVAKSGGAVGQLIGTVAELRPQVAIAEAKAAKLRDDLSNFRVLDSYRELSDRAAQAQTEMLAIQRRAVIQKQTLNHLESALREESTPKGDDVMRLYSALGVELPDTAIRRLDEVRAFHASVVENRRSRLQEEVSAVQAGIIEGEARSAELDQDRSSILRFLEGHGALEDFVHLQKALASQEVEAASLRERYNAAEVLEGTTSQLNIDRAHIRQRLQDDHRARRERLNAAILFIGAAISELYEDRVGQFVVDATDSGPQFSISIQGDRGGGISQIEIFCMDLALFALTGREKRGPGFLIHDSHLFDGVDERQVARALVLGGITADSVAGQYIVTMNSDIFDRLPFAPGLDRSAMVVETRLSDFEDTGGLFGFRFD